MSVQIRQATPEDAGALLALKLALDSESEFMMLEAGERRQDVAQIQQELLNPKENDVLLVTEAADGFLGYVQVIGGEFRRSHHRAELVLGVLSRASGQGVGGALLTAAETWAREKQLRRLELTVMTHNLRALHVYLKQGFQIEGLRRASLRVNGLDVDEYAMFKLLDEL